MKTTKIELPEDLLTLLRRSRLGTRPPPDQVRLALAIHLFMERVISIGKAAELAGEPRVAFELLLGETGILAVQYDESDYEREWRSIQRANGRQRRHRGPQD